MTGQPSGRFWPWFVAILLAATAGAQGLMLYDATHDPTFAVEPDYYEKGVGWDSTMARERETASLGWRASAAIARTAGGSVVRVHLIDSTGAPVRGAHVTGDLVSNLDASHPVAVTLTGDDAGTYVATVGPLHRGLWDIRLDATRAGRRFAPVLRTEYVP